MSKAKELNERIRIWRLLLPKPSQLRSDTFKFRCSETNMKGMINGMIFSASSDYMEIYQEETTHK